MGLVECLLGFGVVSCEGLRASIAGAICFGSVRTILNVVVGFLIQGMSEFLKERG
jgi:hypothetical protein